MTTEIYGIAGRYSCYDYLCIQLLEEERVAVENADSGVQQTLEITLHEYGL